jgi:hypothetical protein
MTNEPNPNDAHNDGKETPKQAQESTQKKNSAESPGSQPPQEPPKDRIKWTDIAIVILTFGIVVAAILQTLIFKKQWTEMHSAGEQTDKLICAANEIKSSLIIANRQNSDAVDRTLKKSQEIADASSKLSERSLTSTIEASKLDERAWVSAELATGFPTNDGSYTIQFPIKNTGKTAATNITVYFLGRFFKPGEKLTYQFGGNPIPSGYLAPNSPRAFIYHGEAVGGIDVAAHKGETFVVYGAITYDDVFSAKHWVTYCFMAQKADSYAYCYEHNDIGDGPLPKDSLQF